jgi:CBS domain containing-hemolysin-like protein
MINLFLLLGILLLLGFFAGVEIAFVSANKLSIELKKKQGRKSGILLSQLLENPWHFVGSCILAYGIFLIIYGLLVSKLIEPFWTFSGIQRIEGSYLIKSISEIIVAVVLVLLFEFTARALFRSKSDGLLSFFAGTLTLLMNLFKPIVAFFIQISMWVLKYLFNIKTEIQHRPFSRIDIEHYYQQTKDASEDVQELNKELFENALSLPGIKIRNCLVPRTEIVAVPIQTQLDEVRKKMVETKLSRLIVFDGNIDNPIQAVPETMGVTDLIGKFSKEHKSIAWVVDEFGGTAGIITLEDLVEEIFGEIHDEYDTDEMVEEKISDSEYIFSGRLKIQDLKERYEMAFPEEPDTLSGYIIKNHNRIPVVKEKIIIGDYRFEVMAMGDAKIEKVKITQL